MLLVVVFVVVVLLWWFFAARRRGMVAVARDPLAPAPDRSGNEAQLQAFQAELMADLARHGVRGDRGIADLIALAKQQAAAALDAPAAAPPAVATEPAAPPPIAVAVAAPTVVASGPSGERSHQAHVSRRPPRFAPLEALPALAPLRPRAALRALEPSAALAARKAFPSTNLGGSPWP